ncbi:MAG: CRISPR-associated RAMP protein, Cmr1 family [Mesotoga infera]|uniref:CRISPR-associated RAMP protein, Cmr1 family n=1 Tax=Mesotoga infera TaxID=1236046 RepID=A0A124G1C6_9BACT|nr:MAG: CRISPR-associated RAMP protein, Cmr1 family [Mesotoga infera]
MKDFIVRIKPLTPIWTGDANRKNTTLRETGIIGSLRWWYEALIRGLGGAACDPTDESSRCKLDHDKFYKAIKNGAPIQEALNAQICQACQLFGCTGWARKFRLEIEGNDITPIQEVWIGTREKRKDRFLKRNISGLMSNDLITLRFIPLKDISQQEWSLLNISWKIIANYGALGAHISQGNGVIEIVENILPRSNKLWTFNLKKNKDDTELPNLNSFFFYKFHTKFKESLLSLIKNNVFWTHDLDHSDFKNDLNSLRVLWTNYHFLPIAFHIRDTIRHLEKDRNKRHEIFGIGGQNAKGSKVFVSHGYKIDDKSVEVRIWGYDLEEDIKNRIKNEIGSILGNKLFLSDENRKKLEECILTEEKEGSELLLEGLR